MKNLYKLFADCIPVKGYQRSIIYDIRRCEFKFIPNKLYDILCQNPLLDFDSIKKAHNFSEKEVIDSYFDFLMTNEFIFQCTKKTVKCFNDIEIKYKTPYLINNVIVEIDKTSKFNLQELFKNLENLGCIDLQIKIFDVIAMNKINDILSYTCNKRIRSIELIIPYMKSFINKENIFSLLQNNLRITSLIIYATEKEEIDTLNVQFKNKFSKIYFCSDEIDSSLHCGFVSPMYFTINLPFFMESKLFNNCLNQKLAIDKEGNIKNCTALNKSYGNIDNDNLSHIISSSEFQKLWKIRKDEVLVCQDCEFRYMCSDCRTFTKNDDLYGKPKYCHYDPYKMKWTNL